jgi:hypothetical protein
VLVSDTVGYRLNLAPDELDAATDRAFRLIGLHPGPDLDHHAAAALTGTAPAQTDAMLGRLARAHLLQRAGSGRYGMHDLLRAYARDWSPTSTARRGSGPR